MQTLNAIAGPSRLRKPRLPFVAEEYKPAKPDGLFRVVIVSSGSVASVKIPDIVGALSKDPGIAIQVVATPASLHFYSQKSVDEAVRIAYKPSGGAAGGDDDTSDREHPVTEDDYGVKVWKDADEWSHFKKVGDHILHIELRRWADLVVIAPCSADMLAKIAGGLCDNLATSLLRALSPNTPTMLFPAMNTHMYQHPLTADHLRVAQERLGYMISGPQGAGRLACGDEGPGKMTDWRDIVNIIRDFAEMYNQRLKNAGPDRRPMGTAAAPHNEERPVTPPTPTVSPTFKHRMLLELADKAKQHRPQSTPDGDQSRAADSRSIKEDKNPFMGMSAFAEYQPGLPVDPRISQASGPSIPGLEMDKYQAAVGPSATQQPHIQLDSRPIGQSVAQTYSEAHWRHLTNGVGGDGSFWQKKWWY